MLVHVCLSCGNHELLVAISPRRIEERVGGIGTGINRILLPFGYFDQTATKFPLAVVSLLLDSKDAPLLRFLKVTAFDKVLHQRIVVAGLRDGALLEIQHFGTPPGESQSCFNFGREMASVDGNPVADITLRREFL